MRTTAAGFCLGYFMVALLIAPSMLWALGAAPDYSAGVVMVLSRSGMLKPLQKAAQQAEEIRDHIMWVADDYLSRRIIPDVLSPQH